jgi:hypothetical protein
MVPDALYCYSRGLVLSNEFYIVFHQRLEVLRFVDSEVVAVAEEHCARRAALLHRQLDVLLANPPRK